ncbi:MAG: hypothetical protein HAW59_02750 [Betaproteobacteria bacterium]|nr:hypothetical protein [Betaproteobacteria bacterium]
MKKVLLIFVLACGFPASAEKTYCQTDIPAAPNPIAEIISIPFKAVAVFSHVPRCLAAYFPMQDDEE